MWANDTNYTVIKNGTVVVSGTGPTIRIDGNKLVIRDGPKDTRAARTGPGRKLRAGCGTSSWSATRAVF